MPLRLLTLEGRGKNGDAAPLGGGGGAVNIGSMRTLGRHQHRRWRALLITPIVFGFSFALQSIWRSFSSLNLDNESSSFLPPPREKIVGEQPPAAAASTQTASTDNKVLQQEKVAAADVVGEKNDWDSSKSVVMGMINGYPLHIYETFVGSLRATGYVGSIILGIASDAPQVTIDYLNSQNVTIKYIENAEKCTYNGTKLNTGEVIDMHASGGWKCTKDYPGEYAHHVHHHVLTTISFYCAYDIIFTLSSLPPRL